MIPEENFLASIHPQGFQPKTSAVLVNKKNRTIQLSSETPGASIGYKIIKDDEDSDKLAWMIYSDPVQINENEKLIAIAHRIGYKPSEVIEIQ